MRRFLACILSALLLCCVFAITATAETGEAEFKLTQDEIEYLKQLNDEPIVLGATSEMVYYTNNSWESMGLLAPFIKVLSQDFSLDVEVRHLGWYECFSQLDSGEIDLLGLSLITDKRKEIYKATDALYLSDIDIYTHVDRPFNIITGMRGRTVGLLANSALPDIIRVYMGVNGDTAYYNTIEELIVALENGEVDCIAIAASIQREVLNHEKTAYELSIESINSRQGVYAKDEKYFKLIDIINRYLRSAQGNKLRVDIEQSFTDALFDSYQEYYKDEIAAITAL